MFRSSLPTSSGSQQRRTLRGVRSFLSETSTSSLAKPTRALVPWESEEHQGPHGPPTGRILSRKDQSRISLRSLPAKIRKIPRPTQTAHVQDIMVEDHCKSAGFVRASGQQRSKFVGVVTIFDLVRCVQREGENPRDYLARWLHIRADLANYPDDNALYHFVEGMDQGTLLRHSLRQQQAT